MINPDMDFPLSPHQFRNWLQTTPPSYSYSTYTGNNTYRWVKYLEADYLEERYNIGAIKEIRAIDRSEGGNITKIEIRGEEGTSVLNRDFIRGGLGGLRSNRFFIEEIYEGDQIDAVIFYGSGWGHNVGLDQTAAAGMAEENFNYEDIIKHFYQNVDLDIRY